MSIDRAPEWKADELERILAEALRRMDTLGYPPAHHQLIGASS